MPKPFILMGDFNYHHTLWGCIDTNDKGRIIEDFITDHDLVLLNDKSSTHLHPATGSYSSVDLSICSPGIFPELTWKVCDYLYGSDHFPIQVSEVGPSVQQYPQRWKPHKANWEKFRVQCEQSIYPNAFEECENPAELFTSLLIRLLKSMFLVLRQIQSTQTNHGLMMNAKRLEKSESLFSDNLI